MDRHKIAEEWSDQCLHACEGICVDCAAAMIGHVIFEVLKRQEKEKQESRK